MAAHRLAVLLGPLLLLLAGPAVAAEPKYTGPWEPATEAAAEAAAARLGARRALEIRRSVLAIRGLESGLVASVSGVRQALSDLGARETELEVRVELPADVLFDFDKADIRPDAAVSLAKLATIIRAFPSGRTELAGHTDGVGADAYNQALSERRAAAVRGWLIERERLDGSRISTRGYGESRPVATNDTDEGRQKNRRVEAVVHKR